jgi:hypothetical protein
MFVSSGQTVSVRRETMNIRMQRMGVGLLAIVAGLGSVAAASTPAVAAPTSAAVHADPAPHVIDTLDLWNLTEQLIYAGPDGGFREGLVLNQGVQEVRGKAYFLVDPETNQISKEPIQAGTRIRAVTKWQNVRFITPTKGALQVRYGDVNRIDEAQTIASVTVLSYRVMNMDFSTQPTFGGRTITVLKLANDPGVSTGGDFYTYDPASRQRASGFVTGGDMMMLTVKDWKMAQLFPPSGTIQVRYGNPDLPETGRVVGWATKL